MLFKKILFLCSKQINGERSIAAIYHLLNGKRSIQSVQDAHIYQLTSYYGILPSLNKKHFDQEIDKYISRKYFSVNTEDQSVYLTQKGEQWLLDHDETINLYGFNGIAYHQNDEIFINRLLLLIQMITNSKMDNYTYVPIIDQIEIKTWAKNIYKEINGRVDQTLAGLHTELTSILSQFTKLQADVFVDRLTGYQTYGLSLNQLAQKYQMQPIDVQLMLIQIVHQMMGKITKQRESFPFLAYVMVQEHTEKFITNSAYETYQLFQNGHSIAEMARIRNLKENTINDHLVEISLYDDQFPFNRYLDQHTYKEIVDVINEMETYKLKDIKDKVDPKITYFQIRLALAKQSFKEGSYVT